MSKNIEKIKGEEAISEIVSVTLDDVKLNGLVSNDIADMYQSSSGLKPIKPIDTYESPIVELKANLKLIFRRLFSVPLTILGSNKGASPISIIKMMEHMFNHYRERLKGSEEYGIPSRLSSLTDLPSAPSILSDRKISEPNAIEGMSLANMLLGSPITEISDDNHGWALTRALNTLWTILPNLSHNRLALNFKTAPVGVSFTLGADAEELVFDDIEEFGATSGYPGQTYDIAHGNSRVKKISIAKLRKWERGVNGGIGSLCKNLYEIYAPSLSYIDYSYWHYTRNENSFQGAINLRKTIFGAPNQKFNVLDHNKDGYDCLNWIHLEFSGEVSINMNLRGWSPTNALDASRTDLIEEGSTATNNLQQFLLNARQYIILRLAHRTSTSSLTLTLSPEVYKAMYGLDADYNVDPDALAQTASLADFGINTEDLNEIEISAGITTATKYAIWLDTYRGAIYWNVQHS